MKKRTIFGLSRLIARPDAQVAARLGAGRRAVGQGEGRAVADRLDREPGEVERSGDLQREEGRRRGDDQRREPERHQHGVHQDAGAGAGHRGEAGGAALGQGAAEEEGHVRAGRQRDDDDRQGEGQQDAGIGQHTTVHAAEKLERAWIGIDVTHLAIGLIEKRLRDAFPGGSSSQTHGVPQDLAGARDLAARGQYHEFEKWALSLIAAQPGNLCEEGRRPRARRQRLLRQDQPRHRLGQGRGQRQRR